MNARTVILLSFFLISTVVDSSRVDAKLMEQYSHRTSVIIQSLTSAKQKAPLLAQDEEKLQLAILAEEVFSIKKVYASSSEITRISSWDLLEQIRSELRDRPKWDEKLAAGPINKLVAHKDFLMRTFRTDTYEWAWVLNQLGKKAEARNVLAELFEKQHKIIMSRNHATFGIGGGPLEGIEHTFHALEALTEGNEKSAYEAKMRAAKKHISSLPQSHILT